MGQQDAPNVAPVTQNVMPTMKKSEFYQVINKIAKPRLMELGFYEVSLKDCMHPEVLFRRGELWFGASWDWRDRILDVSLGELRWFKDVMPRVIVLGNYSSYSQRINNVQPDAPSYLEDVASVIAETLADAVDNYNGRHKEVVDTFLEKKSKYHRVFIEHLRGKVTDDELLAYKA